MLIFCKKKIKNLPELKKNYEEKKTIFQKLLALHTFQKVNFPSRIFSKISFQLKNKQKISFFFNSN